MKPSRLEKRVERKNVKCKVAHLDGYALSFDKPAGDGSGNATISPKDGDRVCGVLYLLTKEELKKLDRYEGVPTHYKRQTIQASTSDGQSVAADRYIAVIVEKGLRPHRSN